MKTVDAETPEELEMVRYIIEQSQKWAREHFNAANAETATLLDAPAYRVTFPTLDTMDVTPMIYGRVAGMTLHYQLVLTHHGPYWLGKHPIYGTNLPKLWVSQRRTK